MTVFTRITARNEDGWSNSQLSKLALGLETCTQVQRIDWRTLQLEGLHTRSEIAAIVQTENFDHEPSHTSESVSS